MRILYSFSRIACLLAMALFAQGSIALGLGELQSESRLNEPLEATIKMVGTEDIEEGELLVRIAGQEDFDRLGVSRDFILTSLLFAVDLESTPAVIHVTTQQPVREPFLNFVLEVQSPKTRLLKEYTILLMPPQQ